MNTDFIVFALCFASLLAGFVMGRWEKQDSQTRTYRHGFNIGKQVGRIER